MDHKIESVKIALRKMFGNSGHFDICTIRTCCDILNVIPDQEIINSMSAVHCIDYSEMTEEFRSWLFSETLKMMDQTGFDLTFIDLLEEGEKSKIFGNLKLIS